MVSKRIVSLACVAGVLPGAVFAAAPDRLAVARIFTDHAVIQRDRPIAIWGSAAKGTAVKVTLADRSATAIADHDGHWRVALPALAAGGPYRLVATAGLQTATLDDIAVGDVYLCGGQSNMEFPARLSTGAWGGLKDVDNRDLRFVTIGKDNAPAPRTDLNTPVTWKPVTADTVGEASAVCYYMARSLQVSQHVPVGFIASDWGGTTIQSWTSGPALRAQRAYAGGVAALALYAADPAAGLAADGKRVEAWWDAHDPQAKPQRAWIAPDYDDTGWDTIGPRGSWKDAGLAPLSGLDGVVWFRTTVTLTEAQARSATALQLGPIDTDDSAWINGARVGGGATAWVWRDYLIPAGTLKAGRNTIVVRVLGGGSDGGLTGLPQNRGVRLVSGALVPLDPTWRYRVGMRSRGLSVTPSPWDVPTSLSTLYNGMIAPLGGYGLKLVAWYQGEANMGQAAEYRSLLPLLMADWRKTFGQPDLPFVVAQLSSYGSVATVPSESGWAELRDVQAKVVRADPHAGLAVTIDVGDRADIHPTQKTVVGERLARAARVVAYGARGDAAGPEAVSVERRGPDLVIRFRAVGNGLRTYSADVAIGFEACTARQCRFRAGTVDGDTVVLAGANTAEVTRVRYAWADAPYVNLYGADDLPAVPFERTVAPSP
ncbi:sialate O-acetylesterase [Sphingomonas psychrolutea]|uniref:9-O-acetylesterase n=1 Tax=Sphingomonas psychrolutea TaxID=1259676 RepID=A0ABQ1GGC5_9SPHN|nr:sialate O-acetylesterase [Sphingomonas psychrolutea]GGA43271.1 9-O-acetylesterase [Sphingomonas psychrolutea]